MGTGEGRTSVLTELERREIAQNCADEMVLALGELEEGVLQELLGARAVCVRVSLEILH